MKRTRIYLTGVGGQGTLTATTLLARTALAQGCDVTSGEIHGMAQRGGVVESTVLLGGWKSPKISYGEADVILGFEPMETLRGLPYLAKGGLVISSTDPISPIAVSRGLAAYPDIQSVKDTISGCAGKAVFLPIRKLGEQAGAMQSGNLAMLAALCSLGGVPFGPQALVDAVKAFMKPSLVDINLKAVALGVEAAAAA
ncbi:MAG: indolepyruvate oxidoreductase subunit beta [Desulfovibrionaceae bacterium]